MKRPGLIALAFLTAFQFFLSVPLLAEVLLQSASRERFGEKGFAYFFIEAEDYHDNDPRGLGESWLLSSDPSAEAMTVNDPVELDPGAFASGDESITNVVHQSTETNEVGGEHDIQYLLRFDTPGTYYLYIRHHSPLGPELDRNKNDSFYYPIEFGEAPTQYKANGDDYGLLESVAFPGDVETRGPWVWFAARQFVENSEQNPPIDQNRDLFREYTITQEMVGQDLFLEFDHRETGTMLDAFLFVETSSDLPATNGAGPDGLGFRGIGDEVDMEFGLLNLGAEICDNKVDDNDDGLVDCADPACQGSESCKEICNNAVDDDGDQLIDCSDPDCTDDAGCQGQRFIRGNVDAQGTINISDPIYLLSWLFQGGTEPACLESGNVDGQGTINISDPIYLLSWLFQGGLPPPAPFPDCGRPDPDPGPEAIDCNAFDPCP